MGQVVSADGCHLDPATVEPVLSLKKCKPTTVDDVRKLLVLLGYYRRYIPHFPVLAKPLYDLLKIPEPARKKTKCPQKSIISKKNSTVVPSSQPVAWEQKHQDAIEKLVDLITNPPILAYPD